ncbi:MAG: hypothetical protein APF77_00705 [Clostridia bacterium BRH_c25]|nr:MAG: hypothetical protein APF77_00705 [Clostridia bacterium BRH_c25]
MGNINSQFIMSTLIIVLGYIIKKYNIITEKDGEALTKIILNVTLPAMVINSTSTLNFDLSLGLMPLFAISYGLIITIFAIFFFRKQNRIDRGMFSMLMPGFSVGLFAYPFVEAILDSKALNYTAMFDIGNSFTVFVMAYSLGSFFSSESFSLDFKSIFRPLTRSIPLNVYSITLILSIARLHYPAPLMNIAQTVSKANMPLSFLVMGIFLSFRIESRHWVNIFKVLGARYLIGITVSLLLYFTLPFNEVLRKIILICFVLPPPITMMAFAVKFNYNKQFVGMLINMANVMSYILLWMIFNIVS